MLSGSTAILASPDIDATVKFYTDILGFASSWTWGDPPSFGAASWGKTTIMFALDPLLAGNIEGHQHWIDAEDVDALYDTHLERGVTIVSDIEDKPWGKREYTVRDINGYHLRFTGLPSHTSQVSQTLPPDVRITCQMPAKEEFLQITNRAFDREEASAEVLDRTWRAIVATIPTGEAIGVARIMYDSPGWFSVWDVAVLPEWQGKRIGTAMMEAAMNVVREESPGAFVYLFTYKPGFYGRLGFETEGVTMRKV